MWWPLCDGKGAMVRRVWWLLVLVLVVLGVPALVQAQAEGISLCKQMRVNAKGLGNLAPITVSSTAIQVADANPSRCSLTFIHEDGNAVRCGPMTGQFGGTPPTGTTGAMIPVGTSVLQITDGNQQAWACIKPSAGQDAVISVLEALP